MGAKSFIEHTAFFDTVIVSGDGFRVFLQPLFLLVPAQGYSDGVFHALPQLQIGLLSRQLPTPQFPKPDVTFIVMPIAAQRTIRMYRFFYAPGACSLAPHIVLEEIGQPYEIELISNRPGEGVTTASAAWKAINPKGRIPALSGVPGRSGGADDLLTEATAIMVYLARTNPASRLMPTEPALEARCLEWMNGPATIHATAHAQMRRPARFADDEKLHPAIQAKGREAQHANYAHIEKVLADGRDWAVPGGYSIVDPYLFVFYGWGRLLGFEMASLFPVWTTHAEKMLARPAVQRVIAQEGVTYYG
jgi:glutathione S-transferase